MNAFSKISENKINIQKSVIFLYTNNNPSKKEIMKTIPQDKVSFHSKPKERQWQGMFKLPHDCTHLTC